MMGKHRFFLVTMLVVMAATTVPVLAQNLSMGACQQCRSIPFSVTAGVPVGGATIGVVPPSSEMGGPGGIILPNPAVFLPPGVRSSVMQNIVRPTDLQLNQQLCVEVFFTATDPGTINLFLGILGCKARDTSSGQVSEFPCVGFEQARLIEVPEVEGLRKVVFMVLVDRSMADADVLTMTIGRTARDMGQDMNPGFVGINAVRISSTAQ